MYGATHVTSSLSDHQHRTERDDATTLSVMGLQYNGTVPPYNMRISNQPLGDEELGFKYVNYFRISNILEAV